MFYTEKDRRCKKDGVARERNPGRGFLASLTETAAVYIEAADDRGSKCHHKSQVHRNNDAGRCPDTIAGDEKQATGKLDPGQCGRNQIIQIVREDLIGGDTRGESDRVKNLENSRIEKNHAQPNPQKGSGISP
jgi:hypothetical protein